MKYLPLAFLSFLAFIPRFSVADDLQFQWKTDEPRFLDVHHVSHQENSLPNQNVVTDTTCHVLFKVQPTKVDARGVTLHHTILLCEDTARTGDKNAAGLMKGLMGGEFDVVLGAGNREFTLVGTDKLVEAAYGDPARQAQGPQRKFFDDSLKYFLMMHLQDAYMPAPKQATAEEWQQQRTIQIQPLFELSLDRKYSRGGSDTVEGRTLDKVAWKSQVELAALVDPSAAFPVKVTSLKTLDPTSDTGSVWWDAMLHLPAKVQSQQKLAADLTMKVGDKQIKSTVTSSDTVTFEFSAQQPKAQ